MKKKVGIYGPWVDLVGVTFFSNPGLKKRLGGLKKKVRVEKNVGGLNKHPLDPSFFCLVCWLVG